MRIVLLFLVVGMFCITGLLADDGDYSMAVGQQQSNLASKSAKKVPNAAVKKALADCNALKEQLKQADSDLSNAYQSNDSKKIDKQSLKIWCLKEKIRVAEKIIDYAYNLKELQGISANYSDSSELKDLVSETKKDIEQYQQNANEILKLKTEQKNLDSKILKAQKMGDIIRQKEVLKKMQKNYNNG